MNNNAELFERMQTKVKLRAQNTTICLASAEDVHCNPHVMQWSSSSLKDYMYELFIYHHVYLELYLPVSCPQLSPWDVWH